MPTISRFFGIIITMYWKDHGPPHFHAEYGGDEIQVSIRDLRVLKGTFPPRALAMVLEWANDHRADLMEDWELCQHRTPAKRIAPLS